MQDQPLVNSGSNANPPQPPTPVNPTPENPAEAEERRLAHASLSAQRWSNWIQAFAAIVSMLAFLGLLKTISQTNEALSMAKENDNQAQKQFEKTMQKTQESLDEFKKSVHEAQVANQLADSNYQLHLKGLRLSEKSMQTQIDNLIASQSRFELENNPYVQVGNFKLYHVDKSMRPIIKFDLLNIGRFPAKISTAKVELFVRFPVFGNQISDIDPYPAMEDLAPKNLIINSFVSQNSAKPDIYFQSEEHITELRFKKLREGRMALHFAGEVYFTNDITNKEMVLKFTILFKSNAPTSININTPIDSLSFEDRISFALKPEIDYYVIRNEISEVPTID